MLSEADLENSGPRDGLLQMLHIAQRSSPHDRLFEPTLSRERPKDSKSLSFWYLCFVV